MDTITTNPDIAHALRLNEQIEQIAEDRDEIILAAIRALPLRKLPKASVGIGKIAAARLERAVDPDDEMTIRVLTVSDYGVAVGLDWKETTISSTGRTWERSRHKNQWLSWKCWEVS